MTVPAEPLRVLFVCAENAARSQMAEGLLRHVGGDRVVVRSAGLTPSHVHPLARAVLAEIDIGISGQRGKGVEPFLHERFDVVVTLCDASELGCPDIPRARERRHRSFDDPAWMEDADGHGDLDEYRRLRDELLEYVRALLDEFAPS